MVRIVSLEMIFQHHESMDLIDGAVRFAYWHPTCCLYINHD